MTVHILTTCRKKELLPETLLVFKTIRTGFPKADILVTNNTFGIESEVMEECYKVDAEYQYSINPTIHCEWMQSLVEDSKEPLVLCDTDMIFYKSVENWEFKHPLAGRGVPEFYDLFTKRMTHSRLHTSLMFINPEGVREAIRKVDAITPDHLFKTKTNLFAPFYYSLNQKPYFHDSMSLLYHAIGGEEFSEEQKDAYTHLQSGTIIDLVGPCYPGLQEAHKTAFDKPETLKGFWRLQEKTQQWATYRL